MQQLPPIVFTRHGHVTKASSIAYMAAGKRWCPPCRKVKPLTAFSKSRATASGYAACCRKCKYKSNRDLIARNAQVTDTTLEARWNDLIVEREDGCMGWAGRFDSGGYAQITAHGRNASAGRVGFVLATGYPLGNEKLRSVCRNRWCVRPEHWDFPAKRYEPAPRTKQGKSNRARRDNRILREVEAAMPSHLPEQVREEMRQELFLAALTGGSHKGNYQKMRVTPKKVKLALKTAWRNAVGDLRELSIDVPIGSDEEGEVTFRDMLLDQSIHSDPIALLAACRDPLVAALADL